MTFRMIVQLWNTNTSAFVSCDADLTENYMYISMKFGTGVHVFCWEVGVFNRSSFQSVNLVAAGGTCVLQIRLAFTKWPWPWCLASFFFFFFRNLGAFIVHIFSWQGLSHCTLILTLEFDPEPPLLLETFSWAMALNQKRYLLLFAYACCGWALAALVQCVHASNIDLVNVIETKPLGTSSSNLRDMLTMMKGWALLILVVKAEGLYRRKRV